MNENVKDIARLIRKVKIGDIRLVEAAVRRTIRSPKEIEKPEVVLKTATRVTDVDKSGVFFVLAFMQAQVVPRDSKEPAVYVKAGFELRYRLPEGSSASRSELNRFAQVNGTFNAWPYWREFIQNMFARMDLPPLTLPLFRIPKQPSRPQKKEPQR